MIIQPIFKPIFHMLNIIIVVGVVGLLLVFIKKEFDKKKELSKTKRTNLHHLGKAPVSVIKESTILENENKTTSQEVEVFSIESDVWPYYKKRVLSQPEQVLYYRLIKALPEHYVFAQVQLSRFIGVKNGFNHQEWLNKINRMSADFLICNKDSSIVSIIELDDSTHQYESNKQRDAKKDKVFETVGLKLIRWNVKQIPDEDEIKSAIDNISKKIC